MYRRRDVIKLGLAGAAGSVLASPVLAADAPKPASPPPATPPPAPPAPAPAGPPVAGPGVLLAQPTDFQGNTVHDLARDLAKQPFKPINQDLPDPFRTLSYEQYVNITPKPEARIWADQTIGFVVEPLHRGFQFNNPIQLNLVADGKAYRLVYDIKLFDFGKLNPSPKVGDIGFSGFRVLVPQGNRGLQEIASYQGTNFFHALAEGQAAGVMARALAIKVADPKGEEMPYFRQLWIEKPSVAGGYLVVHALLDSESLTGAFRYTIRFNGGATIIDTECWIFARTDVDNYGLAAMSATHLLGFMDHKKFDDYRSNVEEVCGLQMLTGGGEWLWRPVTNRDTLEISTFTDNKPRGFGCLIRDRDFESFLDEEQHWERRPSLWIEPLNSDWGEGGVQLIEIPSQSDANDNIQAFWRPKAPLKGGSETYFAYRQFWCWDPPAIPDLARANRSHAGSSGQNGKRRKFLVEFGGDILADAKRTQGMSPSLTASGGSITMMKTFADSERKTYRVLFELDPQSAESSELRLVLEAQGQRLSETWLYRWTPA